VTKKQVATYQAALKDARAAFDVATNRLAEIGIESYNLNDEVNRLRRTITALAALCSEEPMIDTLGITDSCLEVMDNQRDTVTTADVVRALEARGFDMATQKNANASVHAILSRLARRGKIERITDEKDNVSWRGPNYDPNTITDDDIPF
jgi:hypothetical protein